jgi:hypothetical protein
VNNPYYADDEVTLWHGDNLQVLTADILGYDYRLGYGEPAWPANSVDAVVTDPPYGLEFMGREWDSFKPSNSRLRTRTDGRTNPAEGKSVVTTPEAYVAGVPFQQWCQEWATECLRVLKPGGHLLAFGGTRTWHRLACGIEDAGFDIRDSVADLTGQDAAGLLWLYGSGFPKSMDVSKAIDRSAGAERTEGAREWSGGQRSSGVMGENLGTQTLTKFDIPATEDAQQWQGWGTALKPGFEPVVVGRKPLIGTVAQNVLEHGTGALNIDATRTAAGQDYADKCASVVGLGSNRNGDAYGAWTGTREDSASPAGRWPTNVVLGEDAAAELDKQTGVSRSRVGKPRGAGSGEGWGMTATGAEYDDQGGASRFFPVFKYEAKAPTSERPREGGLAHPTVKPLDLMRWLVRLVTPPGGTVLEPFAGSGTTAEACVLEHFKCIAIEREADYLPLIVARLSKPMQVGFDFDGAA